MPSAFIRFHFFQSIGFHLVSVYSVPSFFQSMGFRLFSVYGAISCFSLWGSIFVNSAFKTFNTYSRLDLFYLRQTFLCVPAFNLLRQLPQSGIFHLSFVKPAHIHPPTRNFNVTFLTSNIPCIKSQMQPKRNMRSWKGKNWWCGFWPLLEYHGTNL